MIEWLYAPEVTQTQTDDDPLDHGSCVASKAAGLIHGVSKSSSIIVIKTSHTLLDTEFAFAKVYEDIVRKNRQTSSVILFARGSIKGGYDSDFYARLPPVWNNIRSILVALKRQRVKVVTSSGNDGRSARYIDKLPALWVSLDLLYAVGATTRFGKKSPTSQISRTSDMLWAPGDPFTCAGGPKGEQTYVGTSGASGLVISPLLACDGLAKGYTYVGSWPCSLPPSTRCRQCSISGDPSK